MSADAPTQTPSSAGMQIFNRLQVNQDEIIELKARVADLTCIIKELVNKTEEVFLQSSENGEKMASVIATNNIRQASNSRKSPNSGPSGKSSKFPGSAKLWFRNLFEADPEVIIEKYNYIEGFAERVATYREQNKMRTIINKKIWLHLWTCVAASDELSNALNAEYTEAKIAFENEVNKD